MAQDIDRNNTRKKMVVDGNSWLNHCKEEYVYDAETGKYIRFFNIFEPPDLSGIEVGEDTIIADKLSRIDTIAFKAYGDDILMWVIAYRNNLDLPAQQLMRGNKIKIPASDFVRRKLAGS